MIELSDSAVNQIKHLQKSENKDDAFLRVSVKQGGCSGMSYKLDFDTEKSEKDKSFSKDNTELVIDSKSFLFLAGMTLDYEGGLNGKGFIFSNPNATRTCGCGSSFGV